MSWLRRLVCLLAREGCEPGWVPYERTAQAVALREATERARREADELRDRRLSWNGIYGLERRDERAGDAR